MQRRGRVMEGGEEEKRKTKRILIFFPSVCTLFSLRSASLLKVRGVLILHMTPTEGQRGGQERRHSFLISASDSPTSVALAPARTLGLHTPWRDLHHPDNDQPTKRTTPTSS